MSTAWRWYSRGAAISNTKPIADLAELLRSLRPVLNEGVYCFVSVPSGFDAMSVNPIATFLEREGLSLIIEEHVAVTHRLTTAFRAAWITLTVHSDLNAVGLTAAISTALADAAISCNVLAAVHHDHLFVPVDRAADAMRVLKSLHENRMADRHD
jgi:hypothetical protein